MKIKNSFIFLLGSLLFGLTSCNDYLDREPEDSITPEKYFTSEADLASYTINLYRFNSFKQGSYDPDVFGDDDGTDNQAAVEYSTRWVPGQWLVPSTVTKTNYSDPWNFRQIRHCNYFLSQVLPKYQAGKILGNTANIKHYIGEIYVLRAYEYFDKLKKIGDCPIVTTALTDNEDTLVVASKRQPMNKVARFILQDLDNAISLLEETSPGGKNRISKNVAYLLRSRVALYAGTWLKYHKGTAFVPGGPGWPGNTADLGSGYNIDTEINYFLTEAMSSAKVVGDQMVGKLAVNTESKEGMDASFNSLNPYYTMFCDENMENYDEVIMWKAFNRELGVINNVQFLLERSGSGTGYTRGMVNSFLMRNGLPIYASGSGYDSNWEKQGVTATLQNRDSRIQIFTKRDGDVNCYDEDGSPELFDLTWVASGINQNRNTTGFSIKKYKHYNSRFTFTHDYGTTGSLVFRGAEALLNYMEASYEKTGVIDATADKYWRALRSRAKVNENYSVTIAATNMSEEAKGDFGAYSHGKLIDATLYNIRRERRDEFISEGMRWDDLRRWRACDQIKNYQIEGMRYWGSIYEGNLKGKSGDNLVRVDVSGGTGNMSDYNISGPYIRPYQISKVNNSVFDGYNFTPAYYLSPLPQSVFRQTASGDKTDLNTSVIYQNPGWPKIAGQSAESVQ